VINALILVFYNDVICAWRHFLWWKKIDFILNFSIFSGSKVILLGSERKKNIKGKKLAKLYSRIGKTKKCRKKNRHT